MGTQWMVAVTILVSVVSAGRALAQAKPDRADKSSVNRMIGAWPERPKLGAREMIAKYGQPHEATTERLVWHDTGPFKRISVLKLETPHDFPLPHVDFLEHTITYNVP